MDFKSSQKGKNYTRNAYSVKVSRDLSLLSIFLERWLKNIVGQRYEVFSLAHSCINIQHSLQTWEYTMHFRLVITSRTDVT